MRGSRARARAVRAQARPPPERMLSIVNLARPGAAMSLTPFHRFAKLSTALLADACLRCNVALRLAPPGLRPVQPGMRVAGAVQPARHHGSVDVFLEAIASAEPGAVLVIDNGGRMDEGCVGDLTALEAQA